jgi:hypothetical protein
MMYLSHKWCGYVLNTLLFIVVVVQVIWKGDIVDNIGETKEHYQISGAGHRGEMFLHCSFHFTE